MPTSPVRPLGIDLPGFHANGDKADSVPVGASAPRNEWTDARLSKKAEP